MAMWYAHVQGQQYGPIGEDVLRQWVRDGRLGRDDQVWREGMEEWKAACEVAELADALSAGPGGGQAPFNAPPPRSAGPSRSAYVRPHRGAAVLTLGILSLVLCPLIFGIITVSMSSKDLKAMDMGTMDPSGRGLTKAGHICGIIGCCLAVLQVLVICLQVSVFAT